MTCVNVMQLVLLMKIKIACITRYLAQKPLTNYYIIAQEANIISLLHFSLRTKDSVAFDRHTGNYNIVSGLIYVILKL